MNDIKQTSKLVKTILTENPQTRNSDSFLYLKVLERQSTKTGIRIAEMPLAHFLQHGNEWGFAPFETVRRSRQKIQRQHPDLACTEKVAQLRLENEAIYRDYARSDA